MSKAVLLDLSGVLYGAGQPIPGSIEAVGRLRAADLPLRFLTNSTRSPRRVLLEKLQKMGFELEADELFTPAQAACDLLRRSGATPHLLIHPNLEEDFEGFLQDSTPSAVVIGDAAEYFTYDAMNAAFRALESGAELLALAANRSFLDEDGKRSIDMGAYVHALEYASGVTARVLGKPAPEYFTAALDSMNCVAEHAVMVGDDTEADVAGALDAGLKAAVLVQTGKYTPGDETAFTPCPTHVCADLAGAVDWILDSA